MPTNASKNQHPPKPRLALAVGVIGHRLNRLPENGRAAVERDVDQSLSAVVDAINAAQAKFSAVFSSTPLVSIVSALAEGADRIGAKTALGKGFALDVPLPFARDVYAEDFPNEVSRSEYFELLKKARSVLELPGERQTESRAYEASGLTILGQSDIVLIIWDGGPSAGRGGTTEMVQTAIRTGLPVVLIDANGKSAPKIIWQGLAPASVAVEAIHELPSKKLDELHSVIDVLVRPPSDKVEEQNRLSYFGEKPDLSRVRIEYPLLLAAACVRPLSRTDCNAPDPDALAADFATRAAASDRHDQVEVLANAFGWSDALGVRFAQTFRGAFVMNFLVSALAVVLAALSLLIPPKWLFVAAEVVCILIVLMNTHVGQKRQWHRRWVQPREVAERLRVSLPLWALGTRPASVPGEDPSWISWYVRAVIRQAGLRSGSLIGDQGRSARDSLLNLLAGQCEYHAKITSHRMSRLHHRLEVAGEILFWGTLVVALCYLAFAASTWAFGNPLSEHADEFLKHCVAAVSAGAPAVAAALYGIRLIGDFEGIEHRSKRTHRTLSRLIGDMEIDSSDLIVLRARAREAADIMLRDVAIWRPAAESRGLSHP